MIRIETSAPRSGRENMAADVHSARECLDGRRDPHLRLYSWSPAAISLGAHQDPSLIDASAAAHHGVDIVTRPTGGGAILHADELTYCITLPLLDTTPSDAYNAITVALLSGLAAFGIAADAETWPSSFSPDRAYRTDPLCFSGIARNEIRVGGKKLIGSAQRIYRAGSGERVLLQHGSILLSDAHAALPVYLRERSPGMTEQRVQELKDRSTSIDQLLGEAPALDVLTDAFRRSFERMQTVGVSSAVVEHERQQEVDA